MEALGLHSSPMQVSLHYGACGNPPRYPQAFGGLDEAVNDITLRKPDVIVTIN